MTPHSIDDPDDIVFRLEYASMSSPEISLLREAAAHIRELRNDVADNSIVISTVDGEELCVIDGEMAEFVRKASLTEFFTRLLTEMIKEYESHRRSD